MATAPKLQDVLTQDPSVSSLSVARRLVGQGSVEVDGECVDLAALIEPPAGNVRLRSPQGSRPVRPADALAVRRWLRRRAGWREGKRPDGEDVTLETLERVTLLLGLALEEGQGRSISKRRSRVLGFIFGVRSPLLLLEREAQALIDWLRSDGQWWRPSNAAVSEAQMLLNLR